MGSKEYKEDYRKFIISKWVSAEIESFRCPSLSDFENQSQYYSFIIEKFFPVQKEKEILEIGCGYGYAIYTLQKLGYKNINAIDINSECCNFVKQNFGVNVTCIDVMEFFKRNSKKFDLIIAFDILEHFNKNELVSLLLLIYGSLNNNGLFVMRSPNGGSPKGIYIRYSGFTHEIAFTPLSINELFKTVGFKKVYCIPEPELDSSFIKALVKRLSRKFIGRLLSLDPDFIGSANIIGLGIKSNEE